MLREGYYYRDGLRAWVRVADPRQAPKGARVWRHDEMELRDGKVAPKVAPKPKPSGYDSEAW